VSGGFVLLPNLIRFPSRRVELSVPCMGFGSEDGCVIAFELSCVCRAFHYAVSSG
jgi:hypothetical protein